MVSPIFAKVATGPRCSSPLRKSESVEKKVLSKRLNFEITSIDEGAPCFDAPRFPTRP